MDTQSSERIAVSWVSCDGCGKWRRIPRQLAEELDESATWTCAQNPDPKFNTCSIPQEFDDEVIDDMIAQAEAAVGDVAEDPVERRTARRPTIWQQVSENLYTHRERNEYNDDETMVCGCSRDQEVPCGEGCINRELFQECSENYCPHGSRCTNRRFQLKEYAPLDVKRAGKKGFGLYAKEDIAAGTFLIEYVGEVLEEEEYERRKQFYERSHQRHYYFMNIGNGETVDATRKGGVGRFINHSCEPNCETQKWTVNGEVTIGLFTKLDVTSGTELTFDYNFQRYGDKPVKCLCGAPSCRGIIGGERETADSLGLEITEMDEDGELEDLEPIMVTEADDDVVLTEILEREVGLGWEKGWSTGLQTKVEELARRTGVELPDSGYEGSFDVEFLKAAAQAATSMATSGKKPKSRASKTARRAADPDWGSQPKELKEPKGPKEVSDRRRSTPGSGSWAAFGAAASRKKIAPLQKKVVLNGREFVPTKNSEIQRSLIEMLTQSGRLEDTSKEGVNKFLHLFNLCTLVTTENLVRFRCIDLSILIDTVSRTDGLQAKHMFVAHGLLRQLFKIMVSKKDGLMDVIIHVYRKVLKMLEALPFTSDILLQKLNAETSFADILKAFATHPDYELKNNAFALLRKWSLPFPDTARRGFDRDDRFARSESYKRPHESLKRSRVWESGGNGGREWDRNCDRDRWVRGRNGDQAREIYKRDDNSIFYGGNGSNDAWRNGGMGGMGNRNGDGRNGWDDSSIPGPPVGPEFSPMTDDEQEDGVVIVGEKNDKNEDAFAHMGGNLIRDPFDDASNHEEAGPMSMVFVSSRAWTTPYDPDFDKFVTSCCEKELSKHEGPLLTRAEAGSLFPNIRKKIINGEKKAYEDRGASGLAQHVLDERKVQSRVKQFVKESVDRFKAVKQASCRD